MYIYGDLVEIDSTTFEETLLDFGCDNYPQSIQVL